MRKGLWTIKQAAVLPVKGCYQDPLFASGIRPPVIVCGLNTIRVYHVPMHISWGGRMVPDLGHKSSRVKGLCSSRWRKSVEMRVMQDNCAILEMSCG